MRSRNSRIACLALGGLLLLAPGCAPTVQTQALFPPASDLKPEGKPKLDPSALGSEAALDAHDIAIETWGERGWMAVGRICRWAVALGATLPFDCPVP